MLLLVLYDDDVGRPCEPIVKKCTYSFSCWLHFLFVDAQFIKKLRLTYTVYLIRALAFFVSFSFFYLFLSFFAGSSTFSFLQYRIVLLILFWNVYVLCMYSILICMCVSISQENSTKSSNNINVNRKNTNTHFLLILPKGLPILVYFLGVFSQKVK